MISETDKRSIAYCAIAFGAVLIVISSLMSGSKSEAIRTVPESNPTIISKEADTARDRLPRTSQPTAIPTPKAAAPKSVVKWLKGGKTDLYSDIITDEYKVVLNSQEVFDTGIPIVATTNYYVLDFNTKSGNPNVISAYRSRWSGGNAPGSALYIYKTMVFDHDVLTFTLKLRLVNNSTQETLLIMVEEGRRACGEDDGDVHAEAGKWAERMKRRLK